MNQRYKYIFLNLLCFSIVMVNTARSDGNETALALEETIVTAQKREQKLQDTPIAISVMSDKQLEYRGISNLSMLSDGQVPSLRITPLGAAASTLVTTIRGNAPTDMTQVTREGAVAYYQNGIYIARPQGLNAEMLNIERIEVLRGPQGTLFGRNAVAGAVHIITKEPTGKFDVKQLIGAGNYDALRSVTHVDLPEIFSVKTSIDYVKTKRDGWVENTASGKNDYHEYDKDGARINIFWQPSDTLTVDYAYDKSNIDSTQMYFQLYQGPNGFIDVEPNRETKTRFPVETLDPSTVDRTGNTLNVTWSNSDNFRIKSLTAYSLLEQDTNNNWAGVLSNNGLIFSEDIEQEQLSQELQASGKTDKLDWVTGIYYVKENVNQDTSILFSLENDFTPITPPTSIVPGTVFDLPTSFVDATAESQAIYGQVTWEALIDKLYVTVGARYSEDEKSGNRSQYISQSFQLDSEHVDTTLILDYHWQDNLSTYIKGSTAYKAGGVNIRSASFSPYNKEVVETVEIGAKSEWWNQRVRLNTAIFWTEYDDMQIDVIDPVFQAISETINAKTVDINGFEVELTMIPLKRFVMSINYTYLDGDMPMQPNPLAGGAVQKFETAQTPPHAGSLTADYTFSPWEIGTLSAHLDITSTDQYAYVADSPDLQRYDAHTLINGRVTLKDIALYGGNQSLKISLWGRNITDEEYIIFSFPNVQAYGTPRTAGVDISYQF